MIRQPIAIARAFAASLRTLAPAFLAVLVMVLPGVSAQAADKPAQGAHPVAADVAEESEAEENEEGEEEETEVELEFEEGEEGGEEGALPAGCLLRTATPRVVAHFAHGDLRLTLRYTSESASRVGVSYWLKGARGTLRLGSANRRIGRQGTISLSRHLDERAAIKLRAARTVVVQLSVPRAPAFCRRYLTIRLSPMRPLSSGATLYEPA